MSESNSNMKNYTEALPKIQQISDLPLSDWRGMVFCRPTPRAGQYVMRRYRVAPHTAEVIAALAGLGSDREARCCGVDAGTTEILAPMVFGVPA